MKIGKAAGTDQIPPEFLKSVKDSILDYLVVLFNKIYDSSTFPREWATAIIVPIFKKGNPDNPHNYRGISLLNIVSKVFTSVMTARIYSWSESYGKIRFEQAGFRRQYSTIDHIFTLRQIISNAIYGDKRKKIYCIFVDYQKAFDTVKRTVVWGILEKIGVSGKFISMLKGIYSQVKGRVRADNQLTEAFDCPVGLRQGCKLSPIIFSLLINEVAEALEREGRAGCQLLRGTRDINALLFADDIGAISETPAGLQRAINIMARVSKELGLTINLDKTKIMVFRAGGYLGQREKWWLDGKEIEVVNSYKYLGFTLTTKLSGDIALMDFVGRAKRKIMNIIRALKTVGQHEVDIFYKLLDATVKPLALYAAEVWGVFRYDRIEKLQLFALKRMLGVTKKTPNCMVYGETGRYPFYVDSRLRAVGYWFKIISMEDDRLPKIAYRRELMERRKKFNWAMEIKNILDRTGYSNVWIQQGVRYPKAFLRKLSKRLKDMYNQEWHQKCINTDRCATYMTFKTDFKTESYLKDINLSKFIYAMARLRLGVAGLNCSKTYTQAEPNTDCPFCDKVKETELHLIKVCPTYQHLRNRYLNPCYSHERIHDLKPYLYPTDKRTLKELAQFIHHALKYRKDEIEYLKTRRIYLRKNGQSDKTTQANNN